MPNARAIGIRWALQTKEAGAYADYDIVAESTNGESRDELVRLVQRMVPGTPGVTPGGPDDLPWLVLGSAGLRPPGEIMSLARLRWPDPARTDASRRPIASTLYVDLTFKAYAKARPSYVGLAAALDQLVGGAEAPAPVATPTITVSRGDPEAAVTWIERHGALDWSCAAAATLVSGRPILLVGEPPGEAGPVVDRLRVIDAVLGLLPWGLRADLLVSTWLGRPDAERFSLAFGNRSVAAGRVVLDLAQLGQSGGPSGLTGPAALYHRSLRDLVDAAGLSRVVHSLAMHTDPLSRTDPQALLVALHRRDLVTRSARPTVDGAEEYISVYRPEVFAQQFPESIQVDFFTILVGAGRGDVLAECDYLDNAVLRQLAVDDLLGIGPRGFADLYARHARATEIDAAAVRTAASGKAASGKAAAVRRLAQRQPPAADDPFARDLRLALLASREITTALLSTVSVDPGRLRDWVTELEGIGDELPAWLTVYRAAALADRPLAPDSLNGLDRETANRLLLAAVQLDQLDNILPSATWLVFRLLGDDPAGPTARAVLAWRGPNADVRAAVDLLATLLGIPGGSIAAGVDQAGSIEPYVLTIVDLLNAAKPKHRGECIVGLVDLITAARGDLGQPLLVAIAAALPVAERSLILPPVPDDHSEDGGE